MKESTWAGHVIEHFAMELQTLAGMDTGYGRPGRRANGAFTTWLQLYRGRGWSIRRSGRGRTLGGPRRRRDIEEIKQTIADEIQKMREIRENVRFGPSTGSLVDEASPPRHSLHSPQTSQSLVQLGYGINPKRIQATIRTTRT